ncbi:MAG: hypothetical protein AMXMBFR61_27390 [Fimbriimonadales bacterium]
MYGYDAPNHSEVIACRSRLELSCVTLSLCMLTLVVFNLVILSLFMPNLVMLTFAILNPVMLSLVMLNTAILHPVMLSLSKHDLAVRMVAGSDATLAACGCMLRQAQHDG